MGLAFGGLKSLVQSVAATIAQLAGQAVSALSFTATAASGADGFKIANNGARIHFGSGASDYASSDGTTVTFANFVSIGGSTSLSPSGAINSGSSITVGGGRSFASSGSSFNAQGQAPAAGASSVGTMVGSNTNLSGASAKLLVVVNNDTTEFMAVGFDGKIILPSTDSSGTPGAATINQATGRSAIAAGAATVTITNSLVTAASHVFISPRTRDATGVLPLVTTIGAGSFAVTTTANCTANLVFDWLVIS